MKQAEERIARLASFPQLNPNPVIEVDASGKIIFANPAVWNILETLDMDVGDVDVFLPSDLQSILREKGKSTSIVYREIVVKDRAFGQYVHFVPAFDVARIYAIDITERRQAEEALRQNEQRLARAQEIAHLGSWELDPIRNTLTWSDEVYRIFGLTQQEFGSTYESYLEAVHPDDRAAVDEAYSGSIRDGKDTYEIEYRIICKATGEIRFVHGKCEHLRDDSGRIIRSVGMVHDVTERKRAEEALKKSHAELDERVKERTRELANSQEQLRNLYSHLQSL